MAALSADIQMSTIENTIVSIKMSANAADTYYKGSVVFIDEAGGVQLTAAGTSADVPLGISPKNQVIAAAGDMVEVIVQGMVWVPVGTNIAAADEGRLAVCDNDALTDNPADLISWADAVAANDMVFGRILRVSGTQMLLGFGPPLTGACVRADTGTGDLGLI
jgi:hypothetical protein